MPLLKVQLNHPGAQKAFKLEKGFLTIGNKIVREWNNDSTHYRKFLHNSGKYLDNKFDKSPKNAKLFFWGEWEGNSYFQRIKNLDYRILPNGIHEPFHSITISRGCQNTDPNVFGKFFKHATCKQSGQLSKLDSGSLILFGTTYPSLNQFYVDTVFVTKSYESALEVCTNTSKNYSSIYKEETIEQLGQEYLGPEYSKTKRLYRGQSWWDDNNYFSFVPCKLNHDGNGFERLKISLDNPILNLSSNATGKSFLRNCNLNPEGVWDLIVKMTFEQGFSLGIRFDEPPDKSNKKKHAKSIDSKTERNC